MKKVCLLICICLLTVAGCSRAEYKVDDRYILSEHLKSIGDTVEFERINYTVTHIELTKELNGIQKEEVDYFSSEEVDEDGKLQNDYTYAIVTFTMENTEENAKEVYPNLNTFVQVLSDNRVVELGVEGRYMYPRQERTRKSEYFKYTLDGGEKVDTLLVYLLKDENLTEDLYFMIGNGGTSIDNIENRFIKVEQ